LNFSKGKGNRQFAGERRGKGLYFLRVHTGPGKPGKSWNFTVAFSRTGKSWKRATGPGKCWKSVKLK